MVSATIIFLQTSCALPQAILLLRGRSQTLPERCFSLGKFGFLINATAVAWVIFLDVIACFPVLLPVTPENMSYVSVVVTGLTAFVVILWFTTKKGVFSGPNIDLGVMNERRLLGLGNAVDGTVVTDDAEDSIARSSTKEVEGLSVQSSWK